MLVIFCILYSYDVQIYIAKRNHSLIRSGMRMTEHSIYKYFKQLATLGILASALHLHCTKVAYIAIED